jgi:chain length determinant protein EpsF
MTLQQLIIILRARRQLVTRIFGGVLLATIVLTALWPRQYEASASVVVDVKADPATGTINPDQLLTSYLATQVDVASSERVARGVVKLLKYDQNPEKKAEWQSSGGNGDFIAWEAESLRKKIVVTPSRDSSVINITATARDRKTAAELANAFVKAYVDATIDLKVEPAKQYATWYADRSRDLQSDLQAKQKKLSDYQTANGITATDEKVDIENSRLSDLSAAVTRAQEDYNKALSKERQAEASPENLPDVMQSPLISGLKSDLAQAESRQKDLATTAGVNYPQYKAAEAQAASLRARIATETQNILNSIRSDAQLAQHQLSAAQAALDAQKKRVLDFKGDRDELQVLQNDVLAAQQALDYVTQRRSQSNLESQLQQTNVVPLTLAVEPPYRSSPIVKVNLAVGLLLAILLAVGVPLVLELNNPIVRAGEDLRRVLAVPYLGAVRSSAVEVP